MFKYLHRPFYCLLFVIQSAQAQPDHINFTTLSAKDGLLSNAVNAILKDHCGLMWFATDDGLNKFDGTNFTVYRHISGDTSSLRANEILALHEDKAGNLWVGTSGGGVSRFDRKKSAFIHYPSHTLPAELSSNAVIRGLSSDNTGKLYIAQFEHLFQLDPLTNKTIRIDLNEQVRKTLTCVFTDSKNRIWTGTTNGLYLYEPGTKNVRKFEHEPSNKTSLPAGEIKAITEDKSGNIWIGTTSGLSMLLADGTSFLSYQQFVSYDSHLTSNEINCIQTDDAGQLWIGTSEGLNVLNTKTKTITRYLPEAGNIHSLTSKWIRCAYIDKQGIYWFGTFRSGISKYDKNLNLFNLKLNTVFPTKGIEKPIASAFAENSDGQVFIGTDGAGLYLFNRITGQAQPVGVTAPVTHSTSFSILALHQSSNNKLYLGSYGQGVIIRDNKTGACTQILNNNTTTGLNSNNIFCLKEDSKGNIWVGTNGQGVNVIKNDKVIAKYNPNPDPNISNEYKLPINGYIRDIEEDKQGNIWIGTHGGGIAVYTPIPGKWTIYNQENSKLPGDKIEVLFCDSQGNMWAGTYGAGLCLFDYKSKQFNNYSEKDGLQNTTIYQILEDRNNLLWLTTNTGITSIDINSKKFRNYTHYNGVQNNNFVHTAGLQLTDGTLIFGGLEGINYFNPATLTINHNVPTVLLTDLRISNKSVIPGDDAPISEHISIASQVHLAYKQNFALSFVALNYTIPRQNHYAYKLEGFDKDWNYTGTINTASYTNLDPGEYTFRVKASNNDGIWSTKDTVIKIIVTPPFWRTTYAYIFYVLGIGGLLLYSRYRGITRIRKKFLHEQEQQEVKRLQELDRLKLKFLTNLSHDFRTPISLIIGPVEQLIHNEKTENRTDKLKTIRRNARRLLHLVNQLLDFRKMEEHELKLHLSGGEFIAFVKEATDSFRDLAEKKHIRFHFNSNQPVLYMLFDHDKMERILFNLLSNAFKFTLEGGAIDVDVEHGDKTENGQWVIIKIKDSGIGIPGDKKEQIFERFFQSSNSSAVINQGTGIGLSITKEFIKMHGGAIEVESETGRGTTFTIHIPVNPVPEMQHELQPLSQPEKIFITDYPNEEPVENVQVSETASASADMPLILLVEDSEDFRFYLKDNLRNNFKIIEASNGKEGWQKALANHPQLIVSDINMPEMDGINLVQKLKSDKRTSHIPVILLSALTAEQQQVAGLETGANDYITKPFNFEILHAKIRNLLQLNNTLKNTYTKQIKVLTPEVNMESANEKLLHKLVSYLEENLTDSQLSVERLSKEMGMSRSSLYSKVLELTGQTPVEYIRSYRLDKSIILLEKSDMTIAEVAYQVGFSTPNYFARSFKSKFNLQPSEYIAKIKKDHSAGNKSG